MRSFTAFALLLGCPLGAQTVLQSGAPIQTKDSVYVAEATAPTESGARNAAVSKAYDQAFRVINQAIINCAGTVPTWDLPNFGSIALTEKKAKTGYTVQALLLITPNSINVLLEEALSVQSVLRQEAVRACLSKS